MSKPTLTPSGCSRPASLRLNVATALAFPEMLLQREVFVCDLAGVPGTSGDVIRKSYGRHADDHLRRAVAALSRR